MNLFIVHSCRSMLACNTPLGMSILGASASTSHAAAPKGRVLDDHDPGTLGEALQALRAHGHKSDGRAPWRLIVKCCQPVSEVNRF